ncbi:HPr kinase/phosphorylase [Marivita geojedonensis]|uniref:HPr kinase/phosphorylase C-terminal domain-containing protein n=1 Tax=Marivita geojedonensis TaxID=1123756 RepID=A0A1X4NQ30_9RHOB|nr:HPr kinase/phosphatase C-terminal domain-containing protein [Marivita geojedonensis]OSQ53006.1 hypothetical protein MGEO_00030 [Marivita geojedonensis]PRY82086.1 Hpr(Ser) kinase/phosphatase [Marivita geojedonensis]
MSDLGPLTLHATAVALNGRAVLLKGASGSGKSSLALEMMVRGATLVADDRVILSAVSDGVELTCPDPLKGMIEARGVGLLHADYVPSAHLCLVVDLDQEERDRFPQERTITFFTQTFPLLHNVASAHFPAAILQYLSHTGRATPRL